MSPTPFGASRANPPAPPETASPGPEARAATSLHPVRHPHPDGRARLADAAWDSLHDPTLTEAEERRACQVLIANCADNRAETARDILALYGDPA